MNKIIKILLATLGAINVVFGMFVPITVALIAVNYFGFDGFRSWFIVVLGSLATLYKAISVGFIRAED